MPLNPNAVELKDYDIGGSFLKGIEQGQQQKSAKALKDKIAGRGKAPISEVYGQAGMGEEALNAAKLEAQTAKEQADTTGLGLKNKEQMFEVAMKASQEMLSHPNLNKNVVKQTFDKYFNMGMTDRNIYQQQLQSLNTMPDDPILLKQQIQGHVDAAMSAKDSMAQNSPDANAMLSANTALSGQDVTMRGQDFTKDNNQANLRFDRAKQVDEMAYKRDNLNADTAYRNAQTTIDKNKLVLDREKYQASMNPSAKLSEAQKKQVIGVQNTKNAIQEYRDQLKNFGMLDLASPDARAAMGTKYNNMMLQAKEAYNLGVLNGPDMEILQSVITNPASMKGAVTSNEALDNQASELDRIMTQIQGVAGGNLGSQRQGGATGGWTEETILANPKLEAAASASGMTVDEYKAALKAKGLLR